MAARAAYCVGPVSYGAAMVGTPLSEESLDAARRYGTACIQLAEDVMDALESGDITVQLADHVCESVSAARVAAIRLDSAIRRDWVKGAVGRPKWAQDGGNGSAQ